MENWERLIEKVVFNEREFLPAVAQDDRTGQVRMIAYMNAESLEKTLKTGIVHYFSRSRNELWKKGETSDHLQHVKALHFNCVWNETAPGTKQDKTAKNRTTKPHPPSRSLLFSGSFRIRSIT